MSADGNVAARLYGPGDVRVAPEAVVAAGPGSSDGDDRTAAARDLVVSLGGSFHTVLGDDIARALLERTPKGERTQLQDAVGATVGEFLFDWGDKPPTIGIHCTSFLPLLSSQSFTATILA